MNTGKRLRKTSTSKQLEGLEDNVEKEFGNIYKRLEEIISVNEDFSKRVTENLALIYKISTINSMLIKHIYLNDAFPVEKEKIDGSDIVIEKPSETLYFHKDKGLYQVNKKSKPINPEDDGN